VTPRRTPKGEATRRRLLEAAGAELLANDGAVEIAAVARRAEASPSLLYRYFEGKGGLVAAVVEDVFVRFHEAVIRPDLTDAGDTWLDREQERVRRFVAFFYDDPLAPAVVRLTVGDPQAAKTRQTWLVRLSEAAKGNFRRGQALGELPPDLDAEILGAFVMGGLFDALGAALTAEPPWDRERVTSRLQQLLSRTVGAAPDPGRTGS